MIGTTVFARPIPLFSRDYCSNASSDGLLGSAPKGRARGPVMAAKKASEGNSFRAFVVHFRRVAIYISFARIYIIDFFSLISY